MKQFVLQYSNITKNEDALENVAPIGDTCMSPKAEQAFVNAPFHELFNAVILPRDIENGGVISPKNPILSSADYNTILIRRATGIIFTHYNEQERTLNVYFRLSERHEPREFNSDFYTILEGFIGLPPDIRKGKLLYTNEKDWQITAYMRKLLDPYSGEAATLEAYRRLTVEHLSYLNSGESRYSELKEAVQFWLKHPTSKVLRSSIEADIKTQQLILDSKP